MMQLNWRLIFAVIVLGLWAWYEWYSDPSRPRPVEQRYQQETRPARETYPRDKLTRI